MGLEHDPYNYVSFLHFPFLISFFINLYIFFWNYKVFMDGFASDRSRTLEPSEVDGGYCISYSFLQLLDRSNPNFILQ